MAGRRGSFAGVCVWYWGACRGHDCACFLLTACPDRDPGCHAGGCPPWGHTQSHQRAVVLGRAAVTTESQRLERPTCRQHHTGGPGFPMASQGHSCVPSADCAVPSTVQV